MGVYIKGMEMPSEQYRKMEITLYPNGHVAEYFGDIGRVWEAVPVPPHGDLIDRNALMKMCGMAIDCYDYPNGEHGWCKRSQDAANICEAIEDAPTIIEAEEGET